MQPPLPLLGEAIEQTAMARKAYCPCCGSTGYISACDPRLHSLRHVACGRHWANGPGGHHCQWWPGAGVPRGRGHGEWDRPGTLHSS